MKTFGLLFVICLAVLPAVAQKKKPAKSKAKAHTPGWVSLFDGKTTTGWHTWREEGVKGWHVMDGLLMTHGKNGDLVSNKTYGDFDLMFEFQVSPKGNSGVMYKIIEGDDKEKFFASYASGPEFQIIDDANYPQPITDKQKTGANYDMNAPASLAAVKPAGQWNKGRIVIRNNRVQHFLNGQKVVDYVYGDDAWKTAVAASKFAKWPYAEPHHEGHIVLQDHGDMVSFRNIKIREL